MPSRVAHYATQASNPVCMTSTKIRETEEVIAKTKQDIKISTTITKISLPAAAGLIVVGNVFSGEPIGTFLFATGFGSLMGTMMVRSEIIDDKLKLVSAELELEKLKQEQKRS